MIDPEAVERLWNYAQLTLAHPGSTVLDLEAPTVLARIEDWRRQQAQLQHAVEHVEHEALEQMHAVEEWKRLRENLTQAVELLRKIQWGGQAMCSYNYDEGHLVCPECEGHEPIDFFPTMTPAERRHWKADWGHQPGCKLAAMLAPPTMEKATKER